MTKYIPLIILLSLNNLFGQDFLDYKCASETFSIGTPSECRFTIDTMQLPSYSSVQIFHHKKVLKREKSDFYFTYIPIKGGREDLDFDITIKNYHKIKDTSFILTITFKTSNPLDSLIPKGNNIFDSFFEDKPSFKYNNYKDFNSYVADDIKKLKLKFSHEISAMYLISKSGRATLIRIDGTITMVNFEFLKNIINKSQKWTPVKKDGKFVDSLDSFVISP